MLANGNALDFLIFNHVLCWEGPLSYIVMLLSFECLIRGQCLLNFGVLNYYCA